MRSRLTACSIPSAREWTKHQDRRGQARLAQRDGLGEREDAEPGGAGVDRGARDRRCAVAVRVGLDHRSQLRTAGDATQHADVVAQRAQINLNPAGCRRRVHACSAASPRLNSSIGHASTANLASAGYDLGGRNLCERLILIATRLPLRLPARPNTADCLVGSVIDAAAACLPASVGVAPLVGWPGLICACLIALLSLAACGEDEPAPPEPAAAAAQQQVEPAAPSPEPAAPPPPTPRTRRGRSPAALLMAEADALERNGFWEGALAARDRALAADQWSEDERVTAQLDQIRLLLKLDRTLDAEQQLRALADAAGRFPRRGRPTTRAADRAHGAGAR